MYREDGAASMSPLWRYGRDVKVLVDLTVDEARGCRQYLDASAQQRS